MFDVVEQLKREWTDKYVVVSRPAPELARFAHTTGLVKTVNMNGRCLVEFDQYNNIGWYDIDPAFLKIVPKPAPKPVEAKERPAPKPAAAKPAAAKPAPAAKPAAAAKPAGASRPSTADILAMARAKKAATEAPAAAEPAAPPAAEPPPAEAETAAAAPVAKPAPKPAQKAGGGAAPQTTAEKIAWCRANDAKG